MILSPYPKDIPPAILAEGFIQRVQFRLEHDKLRLKNTSLRMMFGRMNADEQKRCLTLLKDIPALQFAYFVLRNKNKKKRGDTSKFFEELVDTVQGIPYGDIAMLKISLIRGRDGDLMLSLRVFRGLGDRAYPTHLGLIVPPYLATDIRNALDRLIARHKGKLASLREKAAEKYPTNRYSNRLRKVGAKEHEDKRTE